MIKLICIQKTKFTTLNKVYYVHENFIYEDSYFTLLDNNMHFFPPKKWFLTLEEFRENRLVKILNSHVVGK